MGKKSLDKLVAVGLGAAVSLGGAAQAEGFNYNQSDEMGVEYSVSFGGGESERVHSLNLVAGDMSSNSYEMGTDSDSYKVTLPLMRQNGEFNANKFLESTGSWIVANPYMAAGAGALAVGGGYAVYKNNQSDSSSSDDTTTDNTDDEDGGGNCGGQV